MLLVSPVQLHDEERLCFAALQHPQRPLQARPLQGLRALAGIDHHLDQLQLVELGIGLHLGALGIEAHAAVCLLLGAHPQVRDGSRGHEATFALWW